MLNVSFYDFVSLLPFPYIKFIFITCQPLPFAIVITILEVYTLKKIGSQSPLKD